MTNAEARCNKSLRPRKPEGSLGRTAQDVHLDSHTAPELWNYPTKNYSFYSFLQQVMLFLSRWNHLFDSSARADLRTSSTALMNVRRASLALSMRYDLFLHFWVQELCESRDGRPGIYVLMSLTVSVDEKLRHWSQFVPNTSTDIRGYEDLHHHYHFWEQEEVAGKQARRIHTYTYLSAGTRATLLNPTFLNHDWANKRIWNHKQKTGKQFRGKPFWKA